MGCTCSQEDGFFHLSQEGAHVTCILGSSSLIGRGTLQHLANKKNKNLRIVAATRDPSTFNGQLEGIECIQADMSGSVESLAASLEGVHSAFIITPVTAQNRAQIALNAARACKSANIQFVVVLSMTVAGTSTIYGQQSSYLEKEFWDLGIAGCILRIPGLIDNIASFLYNTTLIVNLKTPYPVDQPISAITRQDLAEAYYCIIKNPLKHSLQTYALYSDTFSYKELVKEVSYYYEEVNYEQDDPQKSEHLLEMTGTPRWKIDALLEVDELLKVKDRSMVNYNNKTLKKITGKEATSMKNWIRQTTEKLGLERNISN